VIKKRHGLPVTLNGYCQGGYTALCNLLSGELDDLVDAFITCVAPMDGSRGKGLANFLKQLPDVFNDLAYGTKTLPNGNKVADGTLMGWVYKLKSIETETPLLSMWRDMMLLSKTNGSPTDINKTAAALNYWLIRERNDLSLNMTRVSFQSFNIPIRDDGTLPVQLFGNPLNLKRLQEKKIPWLICYGKQDDLVEPPAALAPTDFVPAEVTAYPKGHVAIATSWSHPESAYALHMRYADENTRGPVRFQLDLQEAIDQARRPKAPQADTQASNEQAAQPVSASRPEEIGEPNLEPAVHLVKKDKKAKPKKTPKAPAQNLPERSGKPKQNNIVTPK
ncbi:MAG: metal transporter, partial [Desulfobacteraceae bacterium]|nr:metal transporter [Desulfobacteraceae bacterium]